MPTPIITEDEERAHLKTVRASLQTELDLVHASADEQFANMLELKQHLSEHKADMDHIEKAGVRQTVDQLGLIGQHTALGAGRLRKLLQSPYFGRLDFRPQQADHPSQLYIGIHSFYDREQRTHVVHDWRAPVSSMFYDFEQGPAHYDAPAGRMQGDIIRKRQYRIEDGELVFMLESALNIHDDVLQTELSRNASDKMKNIVATIQRDQNAIIRNEAARSLVIQGAAGSGKTSIALHRIAFLLYRFKDSIKAEDILILSPNKVFAHYISNVLPELGEENIRETTMEALAGKILGQEFAFQTFPEQVSALFDPKGAAFRERIRFKATPEFLEKLESYVRHVKSRNFTAAPLVLGRRTLPAELIEGWYHRGGPAPFAARINDLVESIAHWLLREHHHEIKAAERTAARRQLKAMFGSTSVETLYRQFYAWLEEPAMCKPAGRGVWEYSDVFPLIHFKLQIEDAPATFDGVKHLVVDEMQDYTPVQYTVLAQLFPCNKTVLGDAWQSINPLSSSRAEGIRDLLPGAQVVYLNKTYRSTVEIAELAQRIHRNEHLRPIERHGEPPAILSCADAADELDRVRERVGQHLASGYKTLGIVCKTQADAARIHEAVRDLAPGINLIDATSVAFTQGVTVATAHLAKGLEFDEVILPFCDAATYDTEIDRHMLYVGVTRAMHRLTLTHAGPVSRFLTS